MAKLTSPAVDQLETFGVQGLTCANCAGKIDACFKEEFGEGAGVNFAAGSIIIPRSQIAKAQAIIDSIEEGVTISVKGDGKQGESHGFQLWRQLLPLVVSGVLFVIGLIWRKQLQATPYHLGEYLVFLSAYGLAGQHVLRAAARNLIRGKVFDENFLMTVATAGAIALRELPEAVAVMLFYYVGELFQDMAVNRSRRSIQSLMDIRPDYANLKVGEDIRRVSPTQVSPGSLIVVRPGERIPLDGEVLAGESFVDTSALTGESVPVKVQPGKSVLAGTVNTTGLLTIEVTKEFGQSSVAKILDLVENATSRKAPTEQFITKFARYYTPAVVAAAAALAIIPPLVIAGASWSQWINRALILLVISCPCALVVSIPLGYFGGIGAASKRGILVKGANFLEALADLDTVVFDKTGTLTHGVFQVTEIVPAPGTTSEELLAAAAAAELHSKHPIATSILSAYATHTGGSFPPMMWKTTGRLPAMASKPGFQGRLIQAGNRRMMAAADLYVPQVPEGGTVVYVAVDGQYKGYLQISDQIKADAVEAVAQLKAAGVGQTVMLTGDNQGVARQVAAQVGIDEVQSQLLPEDKVARVEELLARPSRRGKLAFVGDGINDAPVLTRADVGVAMGGLGSDAAIEAADAVIMDDRPSRLATAIEVARGTRKIVVQNIVFALAAKGVVIALGAFGLASMWMAIFADVGVALIAIVNSTRALRLGASQPPTSAPMAPAKSVAG